MNTTFLTNDPIIKEAAHTVSMHCGDTDFLNLIRAVPKFNHTDMSSTEVMFRLREMRDLDITIGTYKPWYRWSKAIAYANQYKREIYFNEYKTGELIDRVETIYHECCHILGFTHNGNRVTAYNRLTVPYLAANIFVNYLKDKGVL